MTKKKTICRLIILAIVFVFWFVFFTEVKVQAAIVAAFGYVIGQIIIVSCSAALVIWFYNRKRNKHHPF